jgi:hypothetical protein
MNAGFAPPLMTVWLQVRVLPGAPQRSIQIDIVDFFRLKLPRTRQRATFATNDRLVFEA